MRQSKLRSRILSFSLVSLCVGVLWAACISGPPSLQAPDGLLGSALDLLAPVILAQQDVSTGTSISLAAIEVTQTIQDSSNSVRLVAGKATYVRAYFELPAGGSSSQNITALLSGHRSDGTVLPMSPIQPKPLTVQVLAAPVLSRRTEESASLNFEIPSTWTHGQVVLQVLPAGSQSVECRESSSDDDPAGDCAVTVNFENVEPLELKYVKVNRTEGVYPFFVQESQLAELTPRLRAVFPVRDPDGIEVSPTSGSMFWGILTPPTTIEHFMSILTTIAKLRDKDGCKDGCNRIYHGVISAELSLVDGLGAPHPLVSAAKMRSNWAAFGRNLHAHEIGHVLGRSHTAEEVVDPSTGQTTNVSVCGEPGGEPFPYVAEVSGVRRATIGPMNEGDASRIVGFDTYQRCIVDPTQHFELMSYCGPNWRWISEPTYESALDKIKEYFGTEPSNSAPAVDPGSYIGVWGYIDLTTNDVTLLSFSNDELASTPPAPQPGDFAARSYDAEGNPLEEVAFRVEPITDEVPPYGVVDGASFGIISVMLRDYPQVSRIEVLRNGVVLASRVRSPSPPNVQVLFPAGGEVLNEGPITIQWNGGDDDGDLLTYTVQYSWDDGSDWSTLVTETADTQLTVTTDELPGSSDARIRVFASDGVNETWHMSQVFAVPGHSPAVTILSPASESEYAEQQLLICRGEARDLEDGRLPPGNQVWESDIDGELGEGSELVVPASILTEGVHTLTFRATDLDGEVSSAAIYVRVTRVPLDGLAPIAEAGPDQHLECVENRSAPTQLDGSASTSPSGGQLLFEWRGEFIENGGVTDGENPIVTMPVGDHVVTLRVRDDVAESFPDGVNIVVVDTTPPEVQAPSDRVAECAGRDGTVADLGVAWVADSCGGEINVVNDAPPRFPFGTTVVTWTGSDASGNSATATQAVTIYDSLAPTITPPSDMVAECADPAGTEVDVGTATVTDECCTDISVSHDAPTRFPIGTTAVTWTAVDCHGNSSQRVQRVTIVDTTPPVMTVNVAPNYLWPPNHKMYAIHADLQIVEACDASPALVLKSVTSTEPDDAPGGGDGNTTDDIQNATIGTPDFDIRLRAERLGAGPGRTYAIQYQATDTSGNVSFGTDTVMVPHDQDGIVEPISLSVLGAGLTIVSWEPVYQARHFDVIRGRVDQLRTDGSNFDMGAVVCLTTEMTGNNTIGSEDAAVPEPGRAFFYAVQFYDGTKESSYGEPSAAKARVVGAGSQPCH